MQKTPPASLRDHPGDVPYFTYSTSHTITVCFFILLLRSLRGFSAYLHQDPWQRLHSIPEAAVE